jgi:hypothetical protein
MPGRHTQRIQWESIHNLRWDLWILLDYCYLVRRNNLTDVIVDVSQDPSWHNPGSVGGTNGQADTLECPNELKATIVTFPQIFSANGIRSHGVGIGHILYAGLTSKVEFLLQASGDYEGWVNIYKP